VLFVRSPASYHPEVWMMRPDGSGEQRFLTEASVPVATPVGTQIIFQDWTTLTLSIVRADGTKRRPFVPTLTGGTSDPDVSPDGRYVVFTRSTQVGWDVYRSDLNGGDIRQLTQGAFDAQPRWSPDGQFVVFTRWGGNGQLFRVPAEGGDAVPITATDGFCCARWSPDGTRLLFWDLIAPACRTMAPDGTDIQTVDALPASTTGAEWSPDGLQLMTVRADDGQLWRVPLDGGDAAPATAGIAVGRWLP
jgi:Tol biopolymer transport system component